LGHWILSARFLRRGAGLVCGRRYFRYCKYSIVTDREKRLLSTAMCVDFVDRKQEISHLTTLFVFVYPLPPLITARSYVYQTGPFTTETLSTGSSLFQIGDKRHPNCSS
jgi:hypothetical protein